jgi:hypothetical protein
VWCPKKITTCCHDASPHSGRDAHKKKADKRNNKPNRQQTGGEPSQGIPSNIKYIYVYIYIYPERRRECELLVQDSAKKGPDKRQKTVTTTSLSLPTSGEIPAQFLREIKAGGCSPLNWLRYSKFHCFYFLFFSFAGTFFLLAGIVVASVAASLLSPSVAIHEHVLVLAITKRVTTIGRDASQQEGVTPRAF